MAEGRDEQALDVYRRFREVIPQDERGYSMEADYYRTTQKYEQAISVLREGLEACRWAPQSASMLSDILRAVGRYEEAIAAADRGIEATADEQPTTKQSFLVWHRALAKDALFHQRLHALQGSQDEETVEELGLLAESAIDDYSLSLQMFDVVRVMTIRAKDRAAILSMGVEPLALSQHRRQSIQASIQRFSSALAPALSRGLPPEVLQQLAALQSEDEPDD